MRLDEEALLRLMAVGREQRLIEFKGAGNWDQYKAKVIKAALAFPNLEGGGYLVIGVREVDAHRLEVEGLSDEQLESFVYDDVTAAIDPYVDPFVELDLYPITTAEGLTVVVVQFNEFNELPVICKRGGNSLRAGGIYMRNRRRVETAELAGHAELREVLDLAARKMLRTRIAYAAEVSDAVGSERKAFDDELGDF